MIRKILFTIQLLAVALYLQSCGEMLDNPAPRERKVDETYLLYSSIQATKKEILLNEEFSTNSKGWPTSFTTAQSHMFVGNGVLNMMSEGAGNIVATIDLSSFTGNTNFEIETSVQVEYSWYDNGNKVMWGYDATSKQYNFIEIGDDDRQLSIGRFDGRYDNYNYNYFYGSNYYKQGEYNKYTVRKINDRCYYFLNETFIYQEPFTSFKGYRIGFQVGNFNELNVNWLTVKKLNL